MNYLRTHRLKTALFQDEVALVLGLENGASVSRHESGARLPDLRTALAYAALYGVPVAELYAEEYRVIREEITSRAESLIEKVRAEASSPSKERKLQVLEDLAGRPRRKLSSR